MAKRLHGPPSIFEPGKLKRKLLYEVIHQSQTYIDINIVVLLWFVMCVFLSARDVHMTFSCACSVYNVICRFNVMLYISIVFAKDISEKIRLNTSKDVCICTCMYLCAYVCMYVSVYVCTSK